ncbi:MAG: hypothetical protein HUU20_00460 [Pirellulales bacterium]|nr:hypothetical protein [Pirellulales bacterium]
MRCLLISWTAALVAMPLVFLTPRLRQPRGIFQPLDQAGNTIDVQGFG